MLRVLRRLPWPWRRWRVVVLVEANAHALRTQVGLRREQRLHAAERGVCLLPHQLASHQGLQLHDAPQRAQRRPRLMSRNASKMNRVSGRACHII